MIPKLPFAPAALSLYQAFCAELRARGFEGELSIAVSDRTTLATDNSIYQIVPQAVAFPRGTNDLIRIAKLLSEERFHAVHVAPRGGGTGTNGQSLTDGLMVDLSRHMNQILHIDTEARQVRVQTGVVKDQLNAALAPYGLFFAPELSTSNRATIGGMISTDACGQGSCLYGKTRDHVLELTTVLADGSVLNTAPLGSAELDDAKQQPGLVGAIYQQIDMLERENAALVAERFPKLNRCLTGYDLAHLRHMDGRLDLNALLCGSEGTLGFIAEATLKVVPIPKHAALVNMRYDSFDYALRDAQILMTLGAASIETIDSKVLALAQGDLIWTEVSEFFPEDMGAPTKGVNIIEFVGQTYDEIEQSLTRLETALAQDDAVGRRRGYTIARDHHDISSIWNMRKKSVGLLGNMNGNKRPIAFVEDTAVPPEHLADYIAEFRAALDKRGLDYGMFGHVDAGVLHVRPAIDMKAEGAEALIREITEEVVSLTQRYGGLLWGEHGKGVRSEFSPRFFGPLYPAIQAVKRTFDPHNQFNPGKIAAPDPHELYRVDGVPTKGQSDRAIPAPVRKEFDGALHCNGNGACFNWDPDEAMCPSWKGTRDRRHSPKGRAQLMREWLRRLSEQGIDPLSETRELRGRWGWLQFPGRLVATLRKSEDFSHEVNEAMAGCLACKSCTGTCPIKVDVPSFRAKFLELYHGRYLRPLRHHLIGRLETVVPLLSRISGLSNLATISLLTRPLGLVHVPKLSGVNLKRELRCRGLELAAPDRIASLSDQERDRSVVIVPDAFTSHYETEVLLDALDLLVALGFKPWLAPYRPNGKPLHVHGFLGAFERLARRNVAMLDEIARSGVELVGLDPAMTLTYRSEYRAALPLGRLPKVHLLQEWLAARVSIQPVASPGGTFYLLPHCTQRATAPAGIAGWQRIFEAFGLELVVLASGCCGMAGTFGHEAEHRALSEKIYELSWAEHVRNGAQQDRLVADGYSCRSQVKLIDGVRLKHPLQVLLRKLA